MRSLVVSGLVSGLALGVLASPARAEVSVGGSVGAGAQGAATYSVLELRFDAAWTDARVGLGVRGVWDAAEFRRAEWTTAWDAVSIVRDVSVRGSLGETTLGAAAGALAPAHVGTLVDGYRTSLDDRWRTGVRAAARSHVLDASIEIDDVLDTALVAGGARWLFSEPWGAHASIAIDPGGARGALAADGATAIEAGGFRRFSGEHARADVGVSIVAEPSRGASGVAYGSAVLERGEARITARADVRAGTGAVGGLFGPLYRVERANLPEWGGASAGAGASVGVSAPAGWFDLGGRVRPELGGLVVGGAGAPMGKYVQGAVWAALGRDAAAGAAELRVAWSNRLFSALHVARLYRLDAMDPYAVWSLTAWFGAASR